MPQAKLRERGANSRQVASSALTIEAGINVNLLGREQPGRCLERWNKIHRQYGIEGLLQETRGTGSTGRPRKLPLTPEKQIAKLQRENEILKQQVHFLKKLRGWE